MNHAEQRWTDLCLSRSLISAVMQHSQVFRCSLIPEINPLHLHYERLDNVKARFLFPFSIFNSRKGPDSASSILQASGSYKVWHLARSLWADSDTRPLCLPFTRFHIVSPRDSVKGFRDRGRCALRVVRGERVITASPAEGRRWKRTAATRSAIRLLVSQWTLKAADWAQDNKTQSLRPLAQMNMPMGEFEHHSHLWYLEAGRRICCS